MKQSLLRQLLNVWTILCKQWYLLCAYVANKVVNITPPLFASKNNKQHTSLAKVLLSSCCVVAQRYENGITFSRLSLTRCALLVALILGSVNVWGADVTFVPSDYSRQGGSNGANATATSSSVTIVSTKANPQSDHVREYQDGKITISSTSNITKVVFTSTANGNSDYGPQKLTATGYTGSTGKTGTWTGESKSITFTCSKQFRWTQIVVSYEGETTPKSEYWVSWQADGTYLSAAGGNVTEGDKPTLPNNPSDCSNGKKFIGWIDSELSHDIETNKAKIFASATDADPITKVTHFVAVYAIVTTTGGGNETMSYGWEDTVDAAKWTITNFLSATTGDHPDVSAHLGSKYGTTAGKTTGSIQTKEKIANPTSITFYYSKASDNTKTANWKVQTSTNGSTWTDRKSATAGSGVTKGEWKELTYTFASLTDVYIRVYYDGNSAVRTLDDVTITYSAASTTIYSDYTTSCSGSITPTKPDAPTITPEEGTYNETKSITITHATLQNAIWYTINDENINNGDVYENALSLPNAAASKCNYRYTVRAFAMGDENSDIASQTYYFQTATPTISVASGTYTVAQTVRIDCPTATNIWYTTDGTDPASNKSNGITSGKSITIDASCKLRVVAERTNFDVSEEASADYTINIPRTYTITWYNNGQPYTTGGGTTSVTEGERITEVPTPPAAPTTCDQKKFMGWADHEILVATDEKPTLYKALSDFPVPTGNELTIKYYAVFADEVTVGSGSGDYEKITSNDDLTDGDYLIVSGNRVFDGSLSKLDASGNYQNVTISSNTIASTEGDPYKFSIASVDGGYSIRSASGYYIGSTAATSSADNELLSSETTIYVNNISISSGNATISGPDHELKYYAQSGQTPRFRYYKSTSTTNLSVPQLYKKVGGTTTKYSNYVTECEELDETKYHNVTVVVSPVSAVGCSASAALASVYEDNKTTLTAKVGTGYTFGGWEVERTDPDSEGTVAIITDVTALKTTLFMGTTAVTVTAKFVEGEWEIVKNENFLQPGDKVVIADNAAAAVACAGAAGANNLGSQPARFSDDKLTITYLPEAAQIFTLATTEDKRWRFFNDNGTLGANSEDERQLNFNVQNPMTQWAISVTPGSPYTAKILALEGSNSRTIFHNSTSKYFTARVSKGEYNDPNLYYKKTNTPRIIVSTYSLDEFTYPDGRGPSTSKTFTVKGINIHNDASVTLTASADWQICETKDGTYSTSISLSYDEIENKEVTIFVRMGKGLDEGNVSGTLRAVSTDAQARTISLSGTVTPTHEVIWMSEGEQYGMEYVLDNEQAHIPSDPTPAGNCVGKVFVGWSATNIVDNEGKPISTDDRPSDLFTTAPTITADVTYYAVWADVSGGTPASITKMKTGDTFADGDKIVVVAEYLDLYYAIYQENTVSNTYVNKYVLNGTAPTIEEVADNDKNWLTVSTATDGWYLGDVVNGYLYTGTGNSANNLYCGQTKQVWTLSDLGDGTFKLQSKNRNLSYRHDTDASAWRMGGSNYDTNGQTILEIYKYTAQVGTEEYSAYSTSCPCDAPSTPLAIAGETFGTLPIDGSAFTKIFAIVEGSGNGNAVQWEVEPYTASLNRETGVFSTTTAGTYTITAMQSRNGDYCKQVASITFEVRIPDVDYTVTFVDGEGDHENTLAVKTVNWGEVVAPPTSPASCPDCMFVGWTTDESIPDENVAPSFFNFNETTIKGDITLRAVYDKGTCKDTYSRIESTPTEYDAEYVLASPNGQYGMIGVLANGQMTVVPIVNEDNPPTLFTITEPVEDLVWQITKHEGTDYYRVFNRNMHKYLSIAADGSISLGSTPADVYIEFSDEYKELTIYNTSRTYALTWGSSFSRPLSTQDTYDEDTKTYYIATWGFYLYERDCEDAQYTFTSTCCANNPTNVVATATATTITISWDCPVDNADLKIYTNDGKEVDGKAATDVVGKTHTFTGLTKNTDYFIRIWGDGNCAGELTHVTTTDATVDIVDWGTYEGADNDNEYKTGVTLNLSDPDVEATVSVGSETIITEDNERAAATELFFSKYYEAAGDLKMIAIYNGTNTAIDLTDYVIYITEEREFLNLAGQDHTLVLTDYAASIPAGAEYIFYRTGDEMDLTTNDGETLKDCIKFTIQDKLGNAKGLGQETWFETEECVWSGKQSLALFKGDKMIDIIGSHTGSADQEDWSGVDADNSKQLVLKDNWPTIKETYFPVYEGPDFHGDNNGFVALGKSYEDQKDIILSTNRCLLIRKNTVTSGTNAVQSNYNGQGFATLGTEWEGKNISVGGSNTDATTITNVCSSFSAICSFDYTQYYVTYTPLTLENPTLGGMRNTDGTFTIPFDVDNLACKRIKIETKKGDEVLLSTQVRVPIIVDENTTTDGAIFTTHINEIHKAGESSEDLSAEEIAAICKTCDVVVKGGEVTLTHAENTIPQINNLTVQNGAKLKVNDGKHFTVASVTLRSDKDVVPHLILPTNTSELASNQKIVRFTKRIPGDRYYFFSLPFDCNVEDIMLSNGQKAIFNRDIYILYYDGAKRAKEGSSIGGDNWVDIDPTQPLVAGQGYALAVENTLPTEVIFPMTITNTALHELDNASKTINITAHGFDEHGNNISGKKPNNIGWNFVGNPYFTHYGTLADVDLKHGKIEVVDGVVGETWSDVTSLYVNVPEENTDENYIQKKASDINLSPFFPFFVQVGKTGTLEYTPGTRVLPAAIASRYAQEMEDSENSTPIYVGVSLSNGQKSDETSLVINNRFTQEYEVGADLEKLLGFADKPQVYVKDDNYRYAFKALNETDAANTNTVGVYLPAKEATTYTFDIMRNYDLSRVQGVYLTDHVAGTVTNLLQEKYVFTSGYSYTNNRFALSVVLAPKDVTSLTDIEAAWSVWQDAPLHISLQGLCVGDAIRVIDATGKLVSRLTATETSAMFDLPTAGSYCVQTIGVNGMQMKKIVVR